MVFARIIFSFLFSYAEFPKGLFARGAFNAASQAPKKNRPIETPKNASSEPSMKASRASTPKKPLHTPNLQKKVPLFK